MIAIIYRPHIYPDKAEDYKKYWHQVANYFVEKRGALGSCLHQAENGQFVVYSRWPDKATRDASWPGDDAPSDVLPDDIKHAINEMKKCGDRSKSQPEICMQIVDDLLFGV